MVIFLKVRNQSTSRLCNTTFGDIPKGGTLTPTTRTFGPLCSCPSLLEGSRQWDETLWAIWQREKEELVKENYSHVQIWAVSIIIVLHSRFLQWVINLLAGHGYCVSPHWSVSYTAKNFVIQKHFNRQISTTSSASPLMFFLQVLPVWSW